MSFEKFNFHTDILDGINSIGFDKPTAIQTEAIPYILEGKDLIACAQTGTGKTAAYLLPLLHKIITNERKHITAVILVPTRELALQIDQQLEGLAYFAPVSSVPVYGGNQPEIWEKQKQAIVRGVDIIVATPGRLMAHIRFDYTNLSEVNCLILDEADRMLDMGFLADIMSINSALPKQKQTLMFSATMPAQIRVLAQKILNKPEEINLATSKPAEGILQAAFVLYERDKIKLISSLLKDKSDIKSILIFSSSKKDVKQITQAIKELKLNVNAIHSDLEQNDREQILQAFKNREFQILVATNIISRGIDIENIDLVINYHVPSEPEDYIHRIGRTARAKNTGVALTFVNEKEQQAFHRIEQQIEAVIYKSPLPPEITDVLEYNPSAKSRFVDKSHFKKQNKHRKSNQKRKTV